MNSEKVLHLHRFYAIITHGGDSVKICEKCGAYNSDSRMFCVDCGDVLGDKVSDLHEQQIRNDIDAKMDAMYNKRDPIYVSGMDKVFGIASLVGATVSFVLLVIRVIVRQSAYGLFLSIILFLLSAVEALVPRVAWEIEKRRLSFYVRGADDLEPGDAYFIGRKCMIVFLTALGVFIAVFSFLYG